jgi:hypothetical protein
MNFLSKSCNHIVHSYLPIRSKVAGDRSTLLRRSVDAEAALDDTREMLSVVRKQSRNAS